MGVLRTCAKCGGSVSSEAFICPHCNCNPTTCQCLSCEKIFAHADSINGMDPTCWNIFKENSDLYEFSCPVCNKIDNYYNFLNKEHRHPTCSNCGQSLSLYKCVLCQKIVAYHECITLYEYGNGDSLYYHKSCGQLVMKRRRNQGRCVKCGKILKGNRSLFQIIACSEICLSCS